MSELTSTEPNSAEPGSAEPAGAAPTSAGPVGTAPAAAGPVGQGLPRLPRRTERLVLRRFRHGDERDVLAYRSRTDVVRYMPTEPMLESDAGAFIAERLSATGIAANEDRIILAVEHEDLVIGDVVIKAGQLADQQAEIGWVLNPDYHGRGLATEAAVELLEVAFGDLRMHRAWAQLDPRNTASARVCQRLGMRREAHFRHDVWFKGEWGDTTIYAILADEWNAARTAARPRG